MSAPLKVGDGVEVETAWAGWKPGTVTGFCSAYDGEEFLRVHVRLEDGGFISGAHPDCVRPEGAALAEERRALIAAGQQDLFGGAA